MKSLHKVAVAALMHKDVLIGIEVDGWYEFYGNHATEIALILHLVHTNIEADGVNVPKIGFPKDAIERYVTRLVNAGVKVALLPETN